MTLEKAVDEPPHLRAHAIHEARRRMDDPVQDLNHEDRLLDMVERYEALATELAGFGVMAPTFNKIALRQLERLSEDLQRFLETQEEQKDDEDLHP